MHVCVLLPVLDPFKGGSHLPLFAAAKETQFTIVCNRSQAKAEEIPANVKVVTVPGRIGSYYYGISDLLFARSMLKKFSVHSEFWRQFDVIHLNQIMGPALRKLRHTGKPILLLIHHPVTADKEIAIKESAGFTKILWWLRYFLLVGFQKKMCKAATHVATVSETMKQRIASDYGLPLEKISVVPNGVDGEVFTPVRDHECTADVIAIGSFVHPRKGFPYLIELYKRLAESGYKVLDVGRRTDAQRAELAKLKGITSLGTVSEEQLIESLRHARVLVSTSLYEGFGLSLIEALSCGHPAFAFSVGAVPEVLGSIEPALIVETRNVQVMEEKVLGFLSYSQEQREEQGRFYREQVLDRYALKHSAKSLEKLYSDLAV